MERAEESEKSQDRCQGRDQKQLPIRAGRWLLVSKSGSDGLSVFYLFTNPDAITIEYRQLVWMTAAENQRRKAYEL